jgi:hypothetical protein
MQNECCKDESAAESAPTADLIGQLCQLLMSIEQRQAQLAHLFDGTICSIEEID